MLDYGDLYFLVAIKAALSYNLYVRPADEGNVVSSPARTVLLQ
jgi:hypothetical protein